MRNYWSAYCVAACLGLAALNPSANALAESSSGELERLRAEIRRHDELYHHKNAPEITDAEYDALKRRLAELEGVARDEPGRESLGFGDDREPGAQRHRHLVPMTGLDKVHSEAQLRRFHAESTARGAEVFVVEPKYDGLAISVTYAAGRLACAATRGDGSEGDEMTANLLSAVVVPRELKGARAPRLVELRGEAYLRTEDFLKLNSERESAGEAPFAHPRTAAAAMLRAEGSAGRSAALRVVFFGVGAWEPVDGEPARPRTQRELHARLAGFGLPVPDPVFVATAADELVGRVREMAARRAKLGFPTDGAVVKIDGLAGEGRRAVAFKFEPERAETVLTGIVVQVGRTGLATPVALLAPVSLGGATVRRAGLHNAGEIERRDLRVGDVVTVEKAGDVIPVVTGPVLARRDSGAKPFVFPSECSGCGVAFERVEGAVRCANGACPERLARGLEHFASRGALGISGLGPSMADKLIASGHVKSFADLYRLSREDLASLDGVGAKSAAKLHAAIAASKGAPLWRFIVALGLPETGPAAARKLAVRFGSLGGLAGMTREALAPLRLGESAERALLEHFADPDNRACVRALSALGCGARGAE